MNMSINLAEDIYPISELESKAKQLIEKAQATKRPLIITEGGRSKVVIIDIGEFQALREQVALTGCFRYYSGRARSLWYPIQK